MKRNSIPFDQFRTDIFETFDSRWMLLAAGQHTPGEFNIMTVSWGALGVIWNKPMAIAFVRPSRYTYAFMEKSDSFTLCSFPAEFKDQLTLCGTTSGRNTDKVEACGFTPIPSSIVDAPGFNEADLILECRKMYYDDIKSAHFLAPFIEGNYKGRDYHRLYMGEVVAIHGTAAYRKV